MRDKKQWFLDMAELVSRRSTCDRLSVGSVLVQDDSPIAVGYNGAPRGMPHCEENNHGHGWVLPGEDGELGPRKVDHCRNAVHSELNAVLNAASTGSKTEGAVLFSTHSPCPGCYGLLVNAKIAKIYYRHQYGRRIEYDGPVEVIQLPQDPERDFKPITPGPVDDPPMVHWPWPVDDADCAGTTEVVETTKVVKTVVEQPSTEFFCTCEPGKRSPDFNCHKCLNCGSYIR